MHGGRIGSAELAELVARRAQRHLRLEPAALSRMEGIVAESGLKAGSRAEGRSPGTLPAGDGGPTAGISADLEFQPGPEGHPQIRLHIRGELPLVCQRCLEPMDWPVNLDVQLTVVPTDEQAQAAADPFDTVVMPAEGLSPADLVEDEVLASLPLAPVHEPGEGPGECRRLAAEQAGTAGTGETHRPFADLRGRLGRKDGEGS